MADSSAHHTNILDRTKVEDLQTFATLVWVHSTDTLRHALQVLLDANILSAPVKDPQGRFIGFVSVMDVVGILVGAVAHKQHTDPGLGAAALLQQSSDLSSVTVQSVCGQAAEDAYVPVSAGSTLRKAVELMASSGIHRVPVVDDKGNIVSLITESGIIQFLAAHLAELGGVVHKTIHEVGLSHASLISIHTNRDAKDAFELMIRHRVSAIPVLDDHNNLLANISARDVRTLIGLNAGLLQGLRLPVRQFVVKMHETDEKIGDPAIACHKDSKLGDVILKLATSRIHRLYVVQHARSDVWVPTGVVALRDVLCLLTDTPRQACDNPV